MIPAICLRGDYNETRAMDRLAFACGAFDGSVWEEAGDTGDDRTGCDRYKEITRNDKSAGDHDAGTCGDYDRRDHDRAGE